jgi:hypothetical protein
MVSGIADDQDPVLGLLSEIPGDQTGRAEGLQMLRRQIDKKEAILPGTNLGELAAHVFDVRLLTELLPLVLAEGLLDKAEKVFSQCNIESGLHVSPYVLSLPGDPWRRPCSRSANAARIS